ncbi:MAG: DNA mismatch repair protein MutL [Patiriisocius sp.]|jgi:DNA mismatch repair protein MutL
MDIITLLPDAVANQIAAGEVIQRPASVVKELIENSIDAGSKSIHLIIKEAGKKLIQVVDDGMGMSETDARMSFERHATSKITLAEDLFSLSTKGFRGEALASIAAIAHVELKTRQETSDIGTCIITEGSKYISQEPCQHSRGTSISVKNLFYNVPARRKFLKSEASETKHIITEFQRIALAHPDIAFDFHHNDVVVFQLPEQSLRNRIVALFGNKYNERLVPVEEDTEIVRIKGFIGKPESAKKTRGEQYFFVNDRFIKNPYLHHAIKQAYEGLLQERSFPTYFIYMDLDPESIDVNIHPTKTEVKFEDERSLYAILRASIKKSLGSYNLAPTIDFEVETGFSVPDLKSHQSIKIPTINVDETYNPFEKKSSRAGSFSGGSYQPERKEPVPSNWNELYEINQESVIQVEPQVEQTSFAPERSINKILQVQKKYLLTSLKSGIIIIDQHRAHARILYEKFVQNLAMNAATSQQVLFPEVLDLNAEDFTLVEDVWDDIIKLGFDLELFGKQNIKINGIPSDATNMNAKELLESWIEDYKYELNHGGRNKTELLARSLASKLSIKAGAALQAEEMQNLVDDLFACEQAYKTPSGKPIIVNYNFNELDRKFEK